MLTNWILTCLCEDKIFDVTFDIQQDQQCVWKDEITGVPFLILKKRDIWWIEDGSAISLKKQPLRLHTLYPCVVYEKPACIICEPQDQESRIYQVYQLNQKHLYTIGRKHCDINYDSEFISETHAQLYYEQGSWILEDQHSVNGTYLNQKRIHKATIAFQDTLYFMGMWMIMGDTWFAINNPMQRVFVNEKTCIPYPKNDSLKFPVAFQKEVSSYIETLNPFVIKPYTLLDPPSTSQREKVPLLLVLGPSMTMGLASLSSAIFMMIQTYEQTQSLKQAYPTMIMACSMLLGTILWPFIMRRYEQHKDAQKQQKRECLYTSYLKETELSILNDIKDYKQWLQTIFSMTSIPLWQYQKVSELMLCYGYGQEEIHISWDNEQTRQAIFSEDELLQKKIAFQAQSWKAKDVPRYFNLAQYCAIAIQGTTLQRIAYGKFLLFHLVNTYAPTQVLVVLAIPKHEEAYRLFRFLPHMFQDSYRYLCHDVQQARAILQKLHEQSIPIVIISYVASCTKLFMEFAMTQTQTILFAFHEEVNVPQIVLQDNVGVFLKQSFTWNVIKETMFQRVYNEFDIQEETSFPETLGFLAMYQVGKIAYLDIEKRWDSAMPHKSLRAALGIYENGEVCYLDFHEKAHGPHGLLAGTTGSGKSELLLTLLLSLAVSYHPYDVSFVLIDYKGGGMAKTLEKLPHVAGIITNLDGAMIERSLCALNSELLRRQRIFMDVMKQLQITSIDIYAYQKYRKEGVALEPLPHLIIAADEFAELKQQQPQFMEQLIRLARIGRSLGIHLLLATQKPSGVVDEQIWSNAHFHICMKVADKSDSMDMLKREDGALLKHSGRFYLQVGYDEVFEQGQSAYVKMPYTDGVIEAKTKLCFIDEAGNEIKEWKRNPRIKATQNELEVVMQAIQRIAKNKKITPISLWLSPLQPSLIKNERKYGRIAMVDDPMKQTQFPLNIQLETFVNTLLYAMHIQESEQAIKTILYALMTQYEASRLRIAILDMAHSDLCAMQVYPHVYAYANEESEDDIQYIFTWLQTQLTLRKQKEYTQKILLVIHHYAIFQELYEGYDTQLYQLVRDGMRYGIYVVLSMQSQNDIRYRYQVQFPQIFCFALSQTSAFQEILGIQKQVSKGKGKALWKLQEVYEVQFVTYVEENVTAFLKASIQEPQDCMPKLPEKIEATFLKEHYDPIQHRIPIGIQKSLRTLLYIECKSAWVIVGPKAHTFIKALIRCFPEQLMQVIMVSDNMQDVEEANALVLYELPTNLLSTYLYTPWFQKAKACGNILWVGNGLKDARYILDVQVDGTDEDGYWIHQTIEAIRFLEG